MTCAITLGSPDCSHPLCVQIDKDVRATQATFEPMKFLRERAILERMQGDDEMASHYDATADSIERLPHRVGDRLQKIWGLDGIDRNEVIAAVLDCMENPNG